MRTIITVILAYAVLAAPIPAFATAQQGDILLLNGEKHIIQTNPLRAFLAKNPGKLPQSDVMSTANWRGYVATWRVKDKRFVLKDIQILHAVTKAGEHGFSTEPQSVMEKVFPGQKEVLADWFTGYVVIPNGKLLNYVHMGYASTYEKYIVVRVEKGVIAQISPFDYKEFIRFRDAQFAAFKKTEEYRKALADSQAEDVNMSAEQSEAFLREFYSERYLSLIFEDQN